MQSYCNNFSKCEHIILSGGGTKGFSYIGLLKLIQEYNIENQIKTVIGFSAGALFSVCILLKLTYDETIEILFKDNFVNRIIKIDTENVLNFNNNKGLVDGDGIIKLINSIIKFKTGLESMTLLERDRKSVV